MDKISVIVPVFNVEPYLDRCIESLVLQTYSDLEIILVDDGSSDRCPEICDDWSRKDTRIKVLHKQNGGLSDARNAGLKAAEGDFIGFVDSDDWAAPEMYEKLKSAIDKDQSDIAACTVEMVWEKDDRKELLTVCENRVLDRLEAQKALMNESELKQPVWYKLYRRSVLEGIEFPKGKTHEDVYWSYQVVGNARKVSLIDYTGYFYWQRADSIMGKSYSLKRLDAIEAYCQRYEYIRVRYPSLEEKARQRILSSCIYHGQMALCYLPEEERKKAFIYLGQVTERYPVRISDLSGMKATHRLWLAMGKFSLITVCRIKNFLKVGV